MYHSADQIRRFLEKEGDILYIYYIFVVKSTTVGTPVHHPADQIRRFLEQEGVWEPFSVEYINYALALLVFAVR